MPDKLYQPFIGLKKMKKLFSFGLFFVLAVSFLFTFTGCAEGAVGNVAGNVAVEATNQVVEKLSAPWKDYEELQYSSIVGGVESDSSKVIISSVSKEGKKYFKIDRTLFIKDGTYISGALLNADDLKPVSAYLEVKAMKDGKAQSTEISGVYKDKLMVNSNIDGKLSTSSVDLPAQYFDNEYLAMAIREFTLKEGFTTDINISSISVNKIAKLTLKVIGTEKVKVPLGEYECYKLAFYNGANSNDDPLNFWISKDENRNLIKYGQKDNYVELKSIKY